MGAVRTTMYLEDKDRRALELIQGRYGLATLSDAIRFSIRVVQRLDTPESAITQHLLTVRGLPRTREPGKAEALMAQAHRTSQGAQQVIAHAKAFLNRQRQRTAVHPPGLHRQAG